MSVELENEEFLDIQSVEVSSAHATISGTVAIMTLFLSDGSIRIFAAELIGKNIYINPGKKHKVTFGSYGRVTSIEPTDIGEQGCSHHKNTS